MTLFYEPDPDRAGNLILALGQHARPAASLGQLGELLRGDRAAQLVLLGPGVPLAEALTFAGQQRLARPSLGVVLLRDQVDVAVLGEAIRAGVREVVDVADADGLRAACQRSLEVSRQLGGVVAAPAAERTPHGKIITVFAGKGGCGKSTMATNLSVTLADGGAQRVLLVDLDLSFGDVAIMMQLVPERSLVDAIGMAGRLDETGLRSLVTPYGGGVDTLLAPANPADGERVTRELVAETLRLARTGYDYIVVDTPPFFSDQVLAALDASDHYVLIATPDIPSLKNLRLTLDMFDLLEYPKEHRVVVLNRADARVGLTHSDIERVVRAPILGHVPSTRDVPVSINRGTPLTMENPGHPVSRAIRELGEVRFGAARAEAAPEQKRRLGFGLLKGR